MKGDENALAYTALACPLLLPIIIKGEQDEV
jgi:hypothetical protein